MRVKSIIAPVVAPTDEFHWGQVLVLPTAYGVIEVSDPAGRAQDVGLALLSTLSDRLSKPILRLVDVAEVARDVIHPSLISLVLLVPVGTVVYLLLAGEGAVYLKRRDRLAKLLERAGALSGKIQAGDRLLLGTKRLVEAIGTDELGRAFDHQGPQEIAENLAMRLSELEQAIGGAAMVFGVEHFVAVEEEPLGGTEGTAGEEKKEAVIGSVLRLHERFDAANIRRTIHQRLPKLTHIWHKSQQPLEGKNRIIRIVAIASAVLFIVSVVLGVAKQRFSRTDGNIENDLVAVEHAYEEGVALLDLNPVKGRERLIEAKVILDMLTATSSAKTKIGRRVAALSKTVNERLTISMQVYRGEPQLFYDAGLLKKGATISSVGIESDKMVQLDSNGKTVFLLDVVSKNGQVIGGGAEYGSTRLVTMHGDKVYVFVADGIHRVRLEDKKTEPLIIKKDDEWGTIGSLVSFGGNLYLLDTGKSRIWKYQPTEAGFSERREYLNPDTLLCLWIT